MSKDTTIPEPPEWFKKPIPKIPFDPRRDFYICTDCGGQSCGGVYSSLCPRCDGISSDPPRGSRYGYLCNNCSQKYYTCKCDYSVTPPAFIRTPTPVPIHPCCCSCSWCNYLCQCVCCCLSCLWKTSSCKYCCTSKCKCPCCSCWWSWFGCSCSPPPES